MSTEQPVYRVNPKRQLFAAAAEDWLKESKRMTSVPQARAADPSVSADAEAPVPMLRLRTGLARPN